VGNDTSATMERMEWAMTAVAQAIDAINFLLPGGRWHLLEFCDLSLYVAKHVPVSLTYH
jgi:hypothetical protein